MTKAGFEPKSSSGAHTHQTPLYQVFPLKEQHPYSSPWASLVAQLVKETTCNAGDHLQHKTQIRSLGWKDPLEKEVATHSSILAWRIPWTEEPGRLQSKE